MLRVRGVECWQRVLARGEETAPMEGSRVGEVADVEDDAVLRRWVVYGGDSDERV